MYHRIVLKLSGESLAPDHETLLAQVHANSGKPCSFDPERVDEVAKTIVALAERGVQVGVVMGGGNIWRGRFTEEMSAVNADQMGMLATIINALAVQDAITRLGKKATVLTAQDMPRFARLYTRDTAVELLNNGHIVLMAGGSGNPFFTTDTAAVLRAAELGADAVFKGTTAEGVYDSDPRKNPNAKFIREATYQQVIDMNLKIMDPTAFMLCREQKVPEIRIFKMDCLENILKVADGEAIGSVVRA